MNETLWRLSHRCDPAARKLADRHYNRQSIGAANFVPPGRCMVLTHGDPVSAFWVTSWPFAEYTKHEWAGAWICSAFRREGGCRASDLICSAVAATRAVFGDPPELGMVTFIDRSKVPPIHTRKGDVWGYTYLRAGFRLAGETKVNKLLAFQLMPDDMPEPLEPSGFQQSMFR